MTVHKELDKDVTKYFVSGGFAFVHPDSTADICAVEAVKVSDLDADAVRAGLQVGAATLRALGAGLQTRPDGMRCACLGLGPGGRTGRPGLVLRPVAQGHGRAAMRTVFQRAGWSLGPQASPLPPAARGLEPTCLPAPC